MTLCFILFSIYADDVAMMQRNRCRGSCNDINDPYAKFCVPDLVKNINVKVFNLMSCTNQTRHIE